MMFATLLAGTLFLLLSAIALNGWLVSRDAAQTSMTAESASIPVPSEFLPSVFSKRDWEFVCQMNAAALKKLFLIERKHIALCWVAETSSALAFVMRQHALAARHSSNLNPLTELTILARYLSLLVVFGCLSLAIRVLGPVRLGGLAQLAHAMSLRIAEAHRSLQANAQPSDVPAGIRN
jgi:hypothetical protein